MNRAERLGVIADDLTGGAAIAGELVREGRECDVIRIGQDIPGKRSIVVETGSRFLPPELAGQRVREATTALQSAGFELMMKKVDSALKGNVPAELEAYVRAAGTPVLLVPACPAARTSVRGGLLQGEGIEGDRIGAALGRTGIGSVSYLPLELLRNAPEHAADWLQGRTEHLLVCDAETNEDLFLLAQSAQRASIKAFAGTYGLGAAIARAYDLPSSARRKGIPRSQRVTVIVGSASQHAAAQVQHALRAGAQELVIDVQSLLKGEADREINHVRDNAANLDSQVIIVHTSPQATRGLVMKHQAANGWNERDLALNFAPPMAAAVTALGGQTLVLVGGETTGAVAELLDIKRLRITAELQPGVPLGFEARNCWPAIITKPGSFGPISALTDITNALLATDEPLPHDPAVVG